MRVLLTSESYLPYVSGVTISVESLARGLGSRGHEVMVLAPRPAEGAGIPAEGSPGPAPHYAWMASYQLPGVAPPGYRMPVPNPADPAVAEARRFAPDVIHAHSPFVTGLIGRGLARRLERPLVFTHHTRFGDYGHYLGPFAAPGSALALAWLRRFWLTCSAIVAPSKDLAGEIRARLPRRARRRVVVIPSGLDVAAIQDMAAVDPRVVAAWGPDTVVVASLGRLAPEKSPVTVLEAFRLAAVEDPRLRMLFIGGGPLEADLRLRAAEPSVKARVHVTGHAARPEALALLAGSDLFAFASQTETQGLVLAEALAAGLPVVAVEGPGVAESVRPGIDGMIVAGHPPATRPERLAAALAALAEDEPGRIAMARRARSDADRFSLDRSVARMEALYHSVGA